jgi:hypothetical protein
MLIALLALALLGGCATGAPTSDETDTTDTAPTDEAAITEEVTAELVPTAVATAVDQDAPLADVTSIEVSGEPGNYTFSVQVESPDTGCEQYANWWEIITDDGQLLYRRILAHSHTDEQPFTRSGGPVQVDPNTTVWVRAHMNTGGYGGTMYMGSVDSGFQPVEEPPIVAPDLAEEGPQPEECNF